MRKVLTTVALAAAMVTLTAACASAQTYHGFAWNIDAPDATTAQAYHYKITLDATPTPVLLSGVACAGTTTPWLCSGVMAIPTGRHTATLVAFLPDESGFSDATPAITFTQGPPAATNLAPKK